MIVWHSRPRLCAGARYAISEAGETDKGEPLMNTDQEQH